MYKDITFKWNCPNSIIKITISIIKENKDHRLVKYFHHKNNKKICISIKKTDILIKTKKPIMIFNKIYNFYK